MKSRIILIFALFLTLTGFRSDEKAMKQNDTKILRSASAQIQPPRITVRLQDLTVVEGKMGVFQISVADINMCQITWYKDGKPLVPGPDYEFSVEGNTATLIIKRVFAEYQGTYSVRVTNQAGQVESSARLVVKGA